jgi:hypothetical protein
MCKKPKNRSRRPGEKPERASSWGRSSGGGSVYRRQPDCEAAYPLVQNDQACFTGLQTVFQPEAEIESHKIPPVYRVRGKVTVKRAVKEGRFQQGHGLVTLFRSQRFNFHNRYLCQSGPP